MGGARALIASLGASISLVAGAALSLLLVSFVVAIDGFAGGVDASASRAVITLHGPAPATPSASAMGPRPANAVVVKAPAPKPRALPQRVRARSGMGAESGSLQVSPPVQGPGGVGELAPPPAPTTESGPATPSTVDGVREIGDAVSATLRNTDAAARAMAAPLG